MDKKTLRDTYLWKRKTLTDNEFDRRNLLICKNLKELTSLHEKYVHVFLPITKNYEVDTWPVVEFLPSIQSKVIVSRSDTRSNQMTHFEFESRAQLSVNKWGIPEPTHGKQVEPTSIDVVLIPLIVFDLAGHRIGYGKGYYDRFLQQCRKDVLKVGLSLSPPLDLIDFTDPHDVSMDHCVTHLGLYTF